MGAERETSAVHHLGHRQDGVVVDLVEVRTDLGPEDDGVSPPGSLAEPGVGRIASPRSCDGGQAHAGREPGQEAQDQERPPARSDRRTSPQGDGARRRDGRRGLDVGSGGHRWSLCRESAWVTMGDPSVPRWC